MATESGAAVFRAIADFSRLRREARATKKDLKDLGDETTRTSTKLGNTETASGRAAQSLGKVSGAARTTKKDMAGVGDETSRTNRKLDDTDRSANRLPGTLTKLGSALTRVSTGWDKFHKSGDGKKLDEISNAGGRLLTTMLGLAAKGGGLALIGVAATASIGPILSLVGAVVSLSGAIGVLPALVGAGGLAVATLAVGLIGLKEAFAPAAAGAGNLASAQKAADRAAVQGAEQVRAARQRLADAHTSGLRQVASAEAALTRAQQTALTAQEDLTRARVEAAARLEDLHRSLKGAALDERGAVLSLARAQQRLAEVQRSGVGGLDLAEAVLGVDEANQALDDTRDRYADLQAEAAAADKAGVDGADNVVSAQARVTDSIQGVKDAQADLAQAWVESARGIADAERDLAQAIQQAAWARADAADALGKAGGAAGPAIAASAQDFVNAVKSLGPAFTALRLDVQEKLFKGLGDRVRTLGATYMPMLRDALGGMATTFNGMAHDFADWLGQKSTVDDMGASLKNINGFWANLRGAVQPLAQAFLDVFKVGSEFLPAMGKGITDATKKFADFVHGARESGKLKDWIAGGLAQLKALGTVLVNIGRIFVSVFTAGSDAGHGFFQTLADVTGKFADFLKSAEGKTALAKLFAAVAAAAAVILPILKALVTALADVVPVLVAIGEKLGPGVAAVINGISAAVQEAKPHLVGLGEALGKLLDAIGSAGPFVGKFVGALADVLTPVVDGLTFIVKTLVGLFNALPEPVQSLVTHIGALAVAGLLAAVVLNKIVKAAAGISGAFGKAATSVGKLIDTLGGDSTLATGTAADGTVVAAGGGKDTKGKKAKKAAPKPAKGKFGLLGAIAGVASAAAAFDMGGEAMDAFGQGAAGKSEGIRKSIAAGLMGAAGIASMFGPWGLVVAAALAAASLIISNWDTIGPILSGIWTGIAGLATSIWGSIGDFIISVQLTVGAAVVTAWNFMRDTVTGAQAAVGQAVVDSWNWISSTATGAATWVKDTVVGAWVWLRDTVTGAQQAAGQAVVNSWNWITSTVSGAVDSVLGFLDRVGSWLGGAWSSAWDGAVGVVRSVAEGISSAINAVVHAVEDAVSKIGAALSKIGQGVSNAASSVGHALNPLNWFQKGGLVSGMGGHRPIMAEPGEYVEPVAVTKKWLPLLRAINPHDAGSQPADVLPMLGVNDLLRNAAGGATIAAQVASSGALSSGRTVGTSGGAGPTVGDVHVTQIIHNPLPEKPSESASKRIGRAAALGVHVALNGAA